MRGAPHKEFSALIRRISARSSAAIFGRPPRERDFQCQYRRKPAMPAHEGLGPDDSDGLEDRWKPSIQLDQEQAIAVREVGTTTYFPLHHDQLVSERRVL